jgi:hypothetical protein
MEQQRYKRLRLLIKKLDKERKTQAKKIDMLCNDFIAAQRDFIKKLSTAYFAADFYKTIIGITDLERLLSAAGKIIKDELTGTDVTFFLRNADSFETYKTGSDKQIALKKKKSAAPSCDERSGDRLENYFTAELVDNICRSNKLCSLDDMFAMGLQGNLVELSKISAYSIPLSQLGPSVGFILLYCPVENKLTADELNKISAITNGLTQAIQSYQAHSHVSD